MTSAPFPWQRGLAWLQPVLCSQSDEQHWRKGSQCDGGPFYFPLRAPHYETRRSDLMAHRRNSSPKLSKLAANPPICEMWRESFRRSRISFGVAWFSVGAVRPAATLLFFILAVRSGHSEGSSHDTSYRDTTFYDTFPLTPLFGCIMRSCCWTLGAKGQVRNVRCCPTVSAMSLYWFIIS